MGVESGNKCCLLQLGNKSSTERKKPTQSTWTEESGRVLIGGFQASTPVRVQGHLSPLITQSSGLFERRQTWFLLTWGELAVNNKCHSLVRLLPYQLEGQMNQISENESNYTESRRNKSATRWQMIRGRYGSVSKDKTFGKKIIYLGSLHCFFPMWYVYSHLWVLVLKGLKGSSELGEFYLQITENLPQLAWIMSNLASVTWSPDIG